jgi:hypothetical protein
VPGSGGSPAARTDSLARPLNVVAATASFVQCFFSLDYDIDTKDPHLFTSVQLFTKRGVDVCLKLFLGEYEYAHGMDLCVYAGLAL